MVAWAEGGCLFLPLLFHGKEAGGELEGVEGCGELGSRRAGRVFVMLGSERDAVQTSSPLIRARPVRGSPRPISQVTSKAQHVLSSLNQAPHAEGPSQLPNPKLSSRKQLCKQLVSQIGRRTRATGWGGGGLLWPHSSIQTPSSSLGGVSLWGPNFLSLPRSCLDEREDVPGGDSLLR